VTEGRWYEAMVNELLVIQSRAPAPWHRRR
jgi:hypothetical protein